MSFGPDNFTIQIGSGFVFGLICALIAASRNRSAILWFILGLVLNCIALIIILCLPEVPREPVYAPEPPRKPGDAVLRPTSTAEALEAFRGVSWHAEIGGKAHGPFSFDDLKRKWSEGRVGADSLVWTNGMSGWRRVKDVPGLFSALGDVTA